MKMISFFRVTERRWNNIDREKPKYWGEKPVPVPLYPPQIPRGLTRDRNRASAVSGRWLTAWAMARSLSFKDRLARIVFKGLFRTAQEIPYLSVIKTSQLMLYSEIIAVCSEIHTKHINKVRTAQ
jgi:hypothetical protein